MKKCEDCMLYDTEGVCVNLDSQMWNKYVAPDTTACEDFVEFEIVDDCEECRIGETHEV